MPGTSSAKTRFALLTSFAIVPSPWAAFESDSEAAHPLIYLLAMDITSSKARMIAFCAVSP
jgi:hypothetical protein